MAPPTPPEPPKPRPTRNTGPPGFYVVRAAAEPSLAENARLAAERAAVTESRAMRQEAKAAAIEMESDAARAAAQASRAEAEAAARVATAAAAQAAEAQAARKAARKRSLQDEFINEVLLGGPPKDAPPRVESRPRAAAPAPQVPLITEQPVGLKTLGKAVKSRRSEQRIRSQKPTKEHV